MLRQGGGSRIDHDVCQIEGDRPYQQTATRVTGRDGGNGTGTTAVSLLSSMFMVIRAIPHWPGSSMHIHQAASLWRGSIQHPHRPPYSQRRSNIARHSVLVVSTPFRPSASSGFALSNFRLALRDILARVTQFGRRPTFSSAAGTKGRTKRQDDVRNFVPPGSFRNSLALSLPTAAVNFPLWRS